VSCPDFIRDALAPYQECFKAGDRIAVPTECLYPSNGNVTVFLSGGRRACIVSDDGKAVAEIRDHGLELDAPDRYLRQFCHPRGLKWERSTIFSPAVPASGLASAIALVATTSSLAAHWGVHNLKTYVRRDLRKELRIQLGLHFSEERIREDIRLAGASGRQYRFEFVVELGNERRLIVDAIAPEPTTINTRAIAHFDLARTENEKFVQQLVYDDTETWGASDLNLLRMAAQLIPLTHFGKGLENLGAQ